MKIQSFTFKKKNWILTKVVLFGSFWTGNWKNYCHIWCQHHRVCQDAKVHVEQKNALFVFFYATIWKTIVIIEITTIEIAKIQSSMSNKKKFKLWPNLGPKMIVLGNFWTGILRTIAISEIATLKFVKMKTFIQNEKALYLGIKIIHFFSFMP